MEPRRRPVEVLQVTPDQVLVGGEASYGGLPPFPDTGCRR